MLAVAVRVNVKVYKTVVGPAWRQKQFYGDGFARQEKKEEDHRFLDVMKEGIEVVSVNKGGCRKRWKSMICSGNPEQKSPKTEDCISNRFIPLCTALFACL